MKIKHATSGKIDIIWAHWTQRVAIYSLSRGEKWLFMKNYCLAFFPSAVINLTSRSVYRKFIFHWIWFIVLFWNNYMKFFSHAFVSESSIWMNLFWWTFIATTLVVCCKCEQAKKEPKMWWIRSKSFQTVHRYSNVKLQGEMSGLAHRNCAIILAKSKFPIWKFVGIN